MKEVRKLSLAEIKAILNDGDFDGLVSTVEHESMECKGQVYALKEPLGRIELAKDVPSLANSNGGYY